MTQLTIWGGVIPAEFASQTKATEADSPPGFCRQDLQIREGRIASLSAPETRRAAASTTLDATGCIVLPGFIDLHIHGVSGHDIMDATPDTLAAISEFLVSHGTTAFMPTTMTATPAETLAAVANVGAWQALANSGAGKKGARLLGVHLEGPYLSPHFPGAQPATHIRPPDLAEFRTLCMAGPVRMMTLAPEQPGAHNLIAEALAHGVTVVVGHTNATYEECQAAIDLGATQATHTYNAMSGLHHRRPGVLGAVLSDARVFTQLIADNVHVHPAAMKILAACKGAARTILITDAMRATGLPPGEYELGGQAVTLQEGACRLADGTLAGSILTMDRALVNFMAATGWPLAEAWPITSRTPARAIGVDDTLGGLWPGYWADLVLLDRELEVVATVVGGEVVHLGETERLDVA